MDGRILSNGKAAAEIFVEALLEGMEGKAAIVSDKHRRTTTSPLGLIQTYMDYVLKHVALETVMAKEKGTGSGGIRIMLHGLLLAPLATEGQEARPAQRIGYLALGTTAPLAIFIDRLREAGYVDGQNVKIDYRFAEGRHDAKGTLAEELVGLMAAIPAVRNVGRPNLGRGGDTRCTVQAIQLGRNRTLVVSAMSSACWAISSCRRAGAGDS